MSLKLCDVVKEGPEQSDGGRGTLCPAICSNDVDELIRLTIPGLEQTHRYTKYELLAEVAKGVAKAGGGKMLGREVTVDLLAMIAKNLVKDTRERIDILISRIEREHAGSQINNHPCRFDKSTENVVGK